MTGEVRLKLFGEGFLSLKPHKAFNDGKLTLEKLKDDGKGAPSLALQASPTAPPPKPCAAPR